MSKRDDAVATRRSEVEWIKAELGANMHVLKINDASVRVLMAFVDTAAFDEQAKLPRWLQDEKWRDVMVTSTMSQSNISRLIGKDVRSIRNAIRVLEKAGYVSRLPHKAGEAFVTRIHVDKIVSDSLNAYQAYRLSL